MGVLRGSPFPSPHDEADTWFATHALFLLGELRSSRSLPAVLRFLAQDESALSDVVRFCARAGLTELKEPIVALFRSEVIPPYLMSVEDYLDIPPSPTRSTSVFDAYARIRAWPSWDEAYDEMELDDDQLDFDLAEAVRHYGEQSHVCCSCGYEQPHPAHPHTHDPVELPYRRRTPKVGRNDPCPCHSGKKYKRCCGA